jgi:hypothetical protein
LSSVSTSTFSSLKGSRKQDKKPKKKKQKNIDMHNPTIKFL